MGEELNTCYVKASELIFPENTGLSTLLSHSFLPTEGTSCLQSREKQEMEFKVKLHFQHNFLFYT